MRSPIAGKRFFKHRPTQLTSPTNCYAPTHTHTRTHTHTVLVLLGVYVCVATPGTVDWKKKRQVMNFYWNAPRKPSPPVPYVAWKSSRTGNCDQNRDPNGPWQWFIDDRGRSQAEVAFRPWKQWLIRKSKKTQYQATVSLGEGQV